MSLTARVQAILPVLHIWGNGNPGRGKNPVDVPAAHEELLHPGNLRLIEAAADWRAHHLEPSRPNRTRDGTTYYWKHVYVHRTRGLCVPNGAFAVAAALAGLPMRWDNYNPFIHAREPRHHSIEAKP